MERGPRWKGRIPLPRVGGLGQRERIGSQRRGIRREQFLQRGNHTPLQLFLAARGCVPLKGNSWWFRSESSSDRAGRNEHLQERKAGLQLLIGSPIRVEAVPQEGIEGNLTIAPGNLSTLLNELGDDD